MSSKGPSILHIVLLVIGVFVLFRVAMVVVGVITAAVSIVLTGLMIVLVVALVWHFIKPRR